MYEIDYLLDDEKAKICCLDWFKKSDNNRQTRLQKWLDIYTLYHGEHLTRDVSSNYTSKISVPLIFTVVHKILPKLMSSQFSSKTMIELAPIGAADVKIGEILMSVIKYEFAHIPEHYRITYNTFLQSLLYGTGFSKVLWDNRRNALDLSFVDCGDLYIDPVATSKWNARYIIHRIETTFEDLVRKGNYDSAKIELIKDTSYPSSYLNGQQLKDKAKNKTVYEFEANEKIELLELWTPERVIVIANRSIIIRNDVNIYGELPFLINCDYPEPDSIYGQGEGDLLFDSQREYVKKRNQRIANVDMILQSPYAVKNGCGITISDIQNLRMNGLLTIDTDGRLEDAFMRLCPPDVTRGLTSDIEQIKYDAQYITGILDVTTEQQNKAVNDTATGIAVYAESSNIIISQKINNIMYDYSKDLGRMILKYYYLFLPVEKVMRIRDDSNVQPFIDFKVTRNDLQNWESYDIVPVVTKDQVDKRAYQERMLMLLQTFANPNLMTINKQLNYDTNIIELEKAVLRAHEQTNENDILVRLPEQPVIAPQADLQGQQIQAGNPLNASTGQTGLPENKVESDTGVNNIQTDMMNKVAGLMNGQQV